LKIKFKCIVRVKKSLWHHQFRRTYAPSDKTQLRESLKTGGEFRTRLRTNF
jgi:hypothetical protein